MPSFSVSQTIGDATKVTATNTYVNSRTHSLGYYCRCCYFRCIVLQKPPTARSRRRRAIYWTDFRAAQVQRVRRATGLPTAGLPNTANKGVRAGQLDPLETVLLRAPGGLEPHAEIPRARKRRARREKNKSAQNPYPTVTRSWEKPPNATSHQQ